MKRKKEVEIMLTALSSQGICETPELKSAIEQGLKQIRIEKFHERRCAKAWKNRQPKTEDNQPG